FAPGTFSGEIVICDRGVIARVAKSFNVAEGGAGGLLVVNTAPLGLATDNHFIPSVHLEDVDGAAVKAYEAAESDVMATFTPGTASTVLGDMMAAFSSRGGPAQTLGISKPDVTAPGVQILAGHTPMPEDITGGLPGQLFQSIQGTSMSAPHAAGAAALVKDANPGWGPGQIKSALMMTGKTAGVVKEDGTTPADPFDFGSGRIQPADALDATVSISETGGDFLALQDELWNANYPSLYVPVMPGQVTVERTFQNHTASTQSFNVIVDSPPDMTVKVGMLSPTFRSTRRVVVPGSGTKTFAIQVDARDVPLGEVRHALITFDNTRSDETLVFPVTIVRQQAGVTIDKTCTPAIIQRNGTPTECWITIENTTFGDADIWVKDVVPRNLSVDPRSVMGATFNRGTIEAHGTLLGASPPLVDVAIDNFASPAGYLDLTLFTPTVVP
ncbi:MAG: S8 family serine peptidase, partial [Acidimicrobiia bacterium]|nr:S8 family serine peptidase [Acidimicrobiia bacterium]